MLDYYRQIQEIAHNEANRLRSIGYDDNSDEIQGWQSKWWDAENKITSFLRETFDNRLQLSEDYISNQEILNWENGDSEIEARRRGLEWMESDYYRTLIKDDAEYYKILLEVLPFFVRRGTNSLALECLGQNFTA